MKEGPDPALPRAFLEATAVVCREGGLLAGVSLVVKGFFLSGGRNFEHLEMFMMFALVKPEELILKVLKDKGRMLC